MEERNEMDKNIDDEMMPGFRFHPTDEEIVDFYLKRKIQQKSLPIELIKQVDIYKYEPWDLPKELASSGEKEWYFYCPRDRKYRNSARPNRVTRAGFWKATGTDRPIYSSEGKCIGLKKSLVFYRGRAAKGMKTDWMMHEFRLPCLSDSSHPKKFSDKSIPASDSWAICRIFKKTNSMSMAQKALSHPWISQLPGTLVSDMITQGGGAGGASCNNQFCSENISCTTEIASPSPSAIQFCGNTNYLSDIPSSYRPIISSISTLPKSSTQNPVSDNNGDLSDNFISSMFSNPDCIGFEEPSQNQYNYSGFSVSVQQDMHQNMAATDHNVVEEQGWRKNTTCPTQINHQWESTGRSTIGFPFSLPPNDAWNIKATNVASWDSSPPCPTQMSTTYSTNKCYT